MISDSSYLYFSTYCLKKVLSSVRAGLPNSKKLKNILLLIKSDNFIDNKVFLFSKHRNLELRSIQVIVFDATKNKNQIFYFHA